MKDYPKWCSACSELIFGKNALRKFERLLLGKVNVPTLFGLNGNALTAKSESLTITGKGLS